MRILFLDIDGVLIPYPIGNNHWDLNPLLVAKLKEAVESLELVIVISSAWRQYDFPRRILLSFENAGWKNPPIIGRTPKLNYRGEEILDWLSEHPEVESYAILDDETYDLAPPLTNIIKTNPRTGISDNDIAKMRKIFARNNSART